jgi:hypothetical protein
MSTAVNILKEQMDFAHLLFFVSLLPSVEFRVIGVEILVVQIVLDHAHTLAEALEVHDLSFS